MLKPLLIAVLVGTLADRNQAQTQPTEAQRLAAQRFEAFADQLKTDAEQIAAGIFDATKVRVGNVERPCRTQAQTLREARTVTTASERYEAALAVRACVEEMRAARTLEQARLRSQMAPGTLSFNVVEAAYAPAIAAADMTVQVEKAGKDFMSTSFGVGVGFSQGKERITAAAPAADGTLRVTERVRQLPRAILEAHYYGWCGKACNEARFGVGPFFGLAASGDTVEAFALGVMFGWREDSKETNTSSAGFSVGLGAVLDRGVKDLARGYAEGQLLPAGETAAAFETRSKWSPILFFTRTF